MPTPSEHKTVPARILEYAAAIGWTVAPRKEAERQRGFDPDAPSVDRDMNHSLIFDNRHDAMVQEFNPCYAEAEGALPGRFRRLHTDPYGDRKFVAHLRNRRKFLDHAQKRARDMILNRRN